MRSDVVKNQKIVSLSEINGLASNLSQINATITRLKTLLPKLDEKNCNKDSDFAGFYVL
jgi:hypothetical protein